MICGKCGKEVPRDAEQCPYCGVWLKKTDGDKKKRKKESGIAGFLNRLTREQLIISIGVLLITLVIIAVGAACILTGNRSYGILSRGGRGGGGSGIAAGGPGQEDGIDDVEIIIQNLTELNGGTLPEISCDEDGVVSFIDGAFSDKTVTDFNSAKTALLDVKGLFGFSDPLNEYAGVDSYSFEGNKFYRMQQVYNSVPVYGKNMIVETDGSGKTKRLSCEYDPDINIEITPEIGANEIGGYLSRHGYTAAGEVKLYIYNINVEAPVLAWGVPVGRNGRAVEAIAFLSAGDGSIVECMPMESDVAAKGVDLDGAERTFEVTQGSGGYVMQDSGRKIYVYECNNTASWSEITSTDNTWSSRAAVSLMHNMSNVLDFYTNVLNCSLIKRNYIESIRLGADYSPDGEPWLNASSSGDTIVNDKYVLIGFGNGADFARCMDVVGHEFTHSIIDGTCGLEYLNQSGAIHEGYADIIGLLIKNEIEGAEGGSAEWEVADELDFEYRRNLKSPGSHNQPSKVNGSHMHSYCYLHGDHKDHGCDNGGVHTNSGIINHAAYLMYENGINDRKELANLFCRSINYLNPTADFVKCRAAVKAAAKDMGFSDEKISIINNAFDEVGIVGRPMEVSVPSAPRITMAISGTVLDSADKSPIGDAEISIRDNNGAVTSRVLAKGFTDQSGKFFVSIGEGSYAISVVCPGYKPCTVRNINVTRGNTAYLQNTILLTQTDRSDLAQAGGKVSNAVSGAAVSGAQIKLRVGYGVKEGAYLKNADGNDIVLTTDENGRYYSAALPYDYYTAEVVKAGFVTQYIDITAGYDEGCLMQDIVLTPETTAEGDYRITLEWDENPRDEDAHMVGDLGEDKKFHVYYAHKTGKIDGETVSNLDHDDTQGNGFETITLSPTPGGSYKYYVYHYAGSGSLGTSNAIVKVYRGADMIAQYNVPANQGEGRYWNVFKIENGQIVNVNEISDSAM